MGATYTAYPNLNTPDEVISKMYEFVVDKGYNIVQALTDDLDIYDRSQPDGKKFTFMDKGGEYFINMRSQNGLNIFGLNDEILQDGVSKSANTDPKLSGVGMVVSEAWSDSARWYNQYNVPLKLANTDATDVLGAYMPVPKGEHIPEVPEPEEVLEPDPVDEPEQPELPEPPTPPQRPELEEIPPEPPRPVIPGFLYNYDNDNRNFYGRYEPGGELNHRLDNGQIGFNYATTLGPATTFNKDAYIEEYVPRFCYDPNTLNYYSDILPDYVLVYASRYNSHGVVQTASGTSLVNQYTIGGSFSQHAAWSGGYTADGYDANNNTPSRDEWKVYMPTAQELGLTQDSSGNIVGVDPSVHGGGSNTVRWDYIRVPAIDSRGNLAYSASNFILAVTPYLSEEYQQRTFNFVKSNTNWGNSFNRYFAREHLFYFDREQSNGNWVYWPHCSGVMCFIKRTDYQRMVDATRTLEEWTNKTSQEWQDYLQQKQTLEDMNAQTEAQYNLDYADYLAAKQAYDDAVAALTQAYTDAMNAYNQYLIDKARYEDYLILLQRYQKYLEDLEKAKYYYTLYCNEVLSPDNDDISTITFSLLKSNDDYYQVSHLIVGNLVKYENWAGGIIFSGSANRYNMIPANDLYKHNKTSDSVIYPVLSSGKITNTYLRIDIDNAPDESRGHILWASSGEDNITGKPLSMPIRTGSGTVKYGNGEIPHYYYMQSHDRLDSGRNVNTLNCITINMPIFAAVRVDPDVLDNYAAAGEVLGVYFVSMYNIQTSSVYEINYPASNDTCQAFSVGKRRGMYGFDGISIKQMDTPIGEGGTSTSGGSGGGGGDTSTDPFPSIIGNYQSTYPDTYRTDTGVREPLGIS